jgi:serine/threonine-protein kinase
LLNGTYRLERIIAEGGMGVVYEAQHVRLPRRFAVKVLAKPIDAETAATTLARFRREAEIASTLAHPHIVEVFDYQVAEFGAPYLVMELLEGEDLADRLRRGRVAIPPAVRLIAEIAEALDVAHAAGVVHRDLKPANVFLTRRGGRQDFVKVLDFGVSKLIDSATLTQEKAMVGTPLYMSPEQAVGTQELTPESDIFSLGAISYEMLTGRRAFAASSIPSILYQIVHGPTPRLAGKAPGLSSAVDEVFGRVLAKKKDERYKRATQFAEDLRIALGREQPPGARSDTALRNAFDGAELEPLATAPESPSDVRRSAALAPGAADTELDSSTKAEEVLALPHPPSMELRDGDADRSLTGELRGGGGRTVLLVLGVLLAVGIAGGAVYLNLKRAMAPSEPVVAVTSAAAPGAAAKPSAAPAASPSAPASPAAPGATTATRPAANDGKEAAPGREVRVFEPEPISAHAPVQFVFHVFPHGAEVLVDDKKVDGSHLMLSYQTAPHRVVVRAPGYHTLTMNAPSTANRTFELRMDRIVVRSKRPVEPRKKPAHDAAPVQDL